MKLAIVGGCGSSGTTLLAHLLSRHSQVVSGPEMNFFNHKEVLNLADLLEYKSALFRRRRLVNGYKDMTAFLNEGKALGVDEERFNEWLISSHNIRDVYESFADHMCADTRSKLFVEKTPTNVYNFAALAKLFPDLPLIHQIRDGRDVVASLMGRGKTLFEAGSRWLYDTMAGLGARGAPGYLEMRYESLVADPEYTLKCAFHHIKMPYETDILKANSQTGPGTYVEHWRKKASRKAWLQTPEETISTRSVGRYKQVLTPEQLSTVYRIHLTKQTAARLNAPVRSFIELLCFLGYQDCNTETWAGSRPRRTTEWAYELLDYRRRARRSRRYSRKLPPRFTIIAR
jgi:hypothetical protein